jgi:hypothetical protein
MGQPIIKRPAKKPGFPLPKGSIPFARSSASSPSIAAIFRFLTHSCARPFPIIVQQPYNFVASRAQQAAVGTPEVSSNIVGMYLGCAQFVLAARGKQAQAGCRRLR